MVIDTSANTSIANNPLVYSITTLVSKHFVNYLKHFVHDIQMNYHRLAYTYCKTHRNMKTNQEKYTCTFITNSNIILINDDSNYHN
jgi:hypothetical protein